MSRSKRPPARVVALFLGTIGVIAVTSCVSKPPKTGVYGETSAGWAKLPSASFDASWQAYDETEGLSLDTLPVLKRNAIIVLNGVPAEPSGIHWGRNLRLAKGQGADTTSRWTNNLDPRPVAVRDLVEGGIEISTKKLPPGAYALVTRGAKETRGYFFRK